MNIYNKLKFVKKKTKKPCLVRSAFSTNSFVNESTLKVIWFFKETPSLFTLLDYSQSRLLKFGGKQNIGYHLMS